MLRRILISLVMFFVMLGTTVFADSHGIWKDYLTPLGKKVILEDQITGSRYEIVAQECGGTAKYCYTIIKDNESYNFLGWEADPYEKIAWQQKGCPRRNTQELGSLILPLVIKDSGSFSTKWVSGTYTYVQTCTIDGTVYNDCLEVHAGQTTYTYVKNIGIVSIQGEVTNAYVVDVQNVNAYKTNGLKGSLCGISKYDSVSELVLFDGENIFPLLENDKDFFFSESSSPSTGIYEKVDIEVNHTTYEPNNQETLPQENSKVEQSNNIEDKNSTNPFVTFIKNNNNNECTATFNLFTGTLKVPCFKLEGKLYSLEFKLVETDPITFELLHIKQK